MQQEATAEWEWPSGRNQCIRPHNTTTTWIFPQAHSADQTGNPPGQQARRCSTAAPWPDSSAGCTGFGGVSSHILNKSRKHSRQAPLGGKAHLAVTDATSRKSTCSKKANECKCLYNCVYTTGRRHHRRTWGALTQLCSGSASSPCYG